MRYLLFLMAIGILGMGCKEQPPADASAAAVAAELPAELDWAKNANIYEVNIRQYTPEGTIAAFQKHLPRLKEMGVDILWLMPIYPISAERRKGSLGSYYACGDYKAVNPEFGTTEDIKGLVQEAHQMGMHVILDWVANHTGWDHPWIVEHPEYYTKNAQQEITDPLNEDGVSIGWTDVADLDFNNREMRQAMIEDMKYWVREVKVDGFRCDVAMMVPDDFWKDATAQLSALQPVFMLAEAEQPSHRDTCGFNMSYGWSLHHVLNEVAQGKKDASEIGKWLASEQGKYQKGWHMQFITNHDENSWNGTEQDRMGPAVDALAVLTCTFDGMPLLYSGQEEPLTKRLRFFDKDTIPFQTFSKQEFYKTLLLLKKENPALWNGSYGGKTVEIKTDKPKEVYAYYRQSGENRVAVFLNLSAQAQEFTIEGAGVAGNYTDAFAMTSISLAENGKMQLQPWSYLVLAK